jgi:putative aldouronate transport system substrate-binding protein
MSRRGFVRLVGGAAAVGTPLLLAACSSVPSAPAKLNPSGAAATPASSSAKLRMPTYVPFAGPPADLPSTPDGVDAGYFTYPKTLVKSVQEVPGNGEEVTAIVSSVLQVPVAMEQNAAWLAVNKQLGATFKIILTPTADYVAKLNTVIASGDLPDMLSNVHSNVTNAPEFMRTQLADLTPYLSGDAVKDYPNLANISPACWKQTVFNGGIYAVPVPRAPFGNTWKIRQDLVDLAGLTHPRNADELKQFLVALTRPQSNQWAVASSGVTVTTGAFGLNTTMAIPWTFRVPNNWRADASGKLLKDFETDEYKAAVAFTRDLYALGVFHPNSTTYNATALENDWKAGKVVSNSTSWGAYTQQWGQLAAVNPGARARNIKPFAFDGGPPMYHFGPSNFGLTFVKKGTPGRTKLVLRLLNFLAAPFGSQEADLLLYGVKGVDYTPDGEGIPVITAQGRSELTIPWKYITANPSVLFDPARPQDFATLSQEDEKAMTAVAVADPTLGLYSATYYARINQLSTTFYSGVQDIVSGSRPMSDLNALVKDWRDQGGDKSRTDFEQALADSKK